MMNLKQRLEYEKELAKLDWFMKFCDSRIREIIPWYDGQLLNFDELKFENPQTAEMLLVFIEHRNDMIQHKKQLRKEYMQ